MNIFSNNIIVLLVIQVHSCLSSGIAVGLGKIKLSSVSTLCSSILQHQDSSSSYSSGLQQHTQKYQEEMVG